MPARVRSDNSSHAASDQAERVRRDHEAIAHLADDLLPALIAKLAASRLGEIEIRQGEEIGRPSVLYARARGSREAVERIEVGGCAVVVARGEFGLPAGF